MVLPSFNSTLSVRSDTSTPIALGTFISTVEVFIPRFYDFRLVFFNHFLNTRKFRPTKSAAFLQPDRIKPKFCNVVVTLDMHVHGFVAIPGVKEKPIWPVPQYCRHLQSPDWLILST